MGRVKEYVDGSGIYLVTKIKNRNKCATWQISDLCAKILQKFHLAADGSYLTRRTVYKLRSNKLIDTKGHKNQFDIETVVDEEDIVQNISNEEEKLYKFLIENDGNITYDLINNHKNSSIQVINAKKANTVKQKGIILPQNKRQTIINDLHDWQQEDEYTFSEAMLRHFIFGNVLTDKRNYIDSNKANKCINLLFPLNCLKCNKVFTKQSELTKHFFKAHPDIVNDCIKKYFICFLIYILKCSSINAQKQYISIINVKFALKNRASLDLYNCMADNKHWAIINNFINTYYGKKTHQNDNSLAIMNLKKMFNYLENGCYPKSFLFNSHKKINNHSDNISIKDTTSQNQNIKGNYEEQIEITILNKYLTDKFNYKLVTCPAGSYISDNSQQENTSNTCGKPTKKIIKKPFAIGIFPVTEEMYTKVMNNNSNYTNRNKPVTNVTWYDTSNFCDKLNSLCENVLPNNYYFALPTEDEWEYACRAGSQTIIYEFKGINNKVPIGCELFKIAWYKKNSEGKTHNVGEKLPNNWGVYDMIGNVWEWCDDSDENNDDLKIIRGGCSRLKAKQCRCTSRALLPINSKDLFTGFRIVLIKKE